MVLPHIGSVFQYLAVLSWADSNITKLYMLDTKFNDLHNRNFKLFLPRAVFWGPIIYRSYFSSTVAILYTVIWPKSNLSIHLIILKCIGFMNFAIFFKNFWNVHSKNCYADIDMHNTEKTTGKESTTYHPMLCMNRRIKTSVQTGIWATRKTTQNHVNISLKTSHT